MSRLEIGLAVAYLFCVASLPACASDIVINELHYDPVEKPHRTEFVELYNVGTSTVS